MQQIPSVNSFKFFKSLNSFKLFKLLTRSSLQPHQVNTSLDSKQLYANVLHQKTELAQLTWFCFSPSRGHHHVLFSKDIPFYVNSTGWLSNNAFVKVLRFLYFFCPWFALKWKVTSMWQCQLRLLPPLPWPHYLPLGQSTITFGLAYDQHQRAVIGHGAHRTTSFTVAVWCKTIRLENMNLRVHVKHWSKSE